MDVEKANETGTPEWIQLVDYTKDYGLNGGVSPDTLFDFTERYQTDRKLYYQFAWDKTRHYGTKPKRHHKKSAHSDYCNYTASSSYASAVCS